jgi:Protein of unknown function (DUF2950)
MKPNVARRIHAALIAIAVVLLATTTVLGASPQTAGATRPAAAPAATVKTFDSPQQAVGALFAAAETFDVPALEQLFGPAMKNVILSKETALDRERAKEFVAKAREKEGHLHRPEEPQSRDSRGRQGQLAVPRAAREARREVVL